MPQTSASGTFVVQVAAVSHQEDADLLVNALHSRGYTVAAHTEAGDRLVHIQVGPFSTKKDAEAMKARLTSDGYNAYIK
jgi:DedD protein